ncbi:GntR family transcriptional regulator [Streptomyces filipinensis]|uniref:GntR family transcriptional regulator n=1 Tax=Streptomyces filipinensis TaxID=66887 RepID=A0A918MFD1_9ACTN|nr:GntR family transcriptional regulator [Streptomyces filipinensis]GGV31078.1 GntR family transcriptional regulator [Streptomyces filipinensis]
MARYEEVADDLRQRIHSGEYAVGGTLPRYEELTATYGVGRGVVSAALALLEREGLVRPIKRKGIVVLDWRIERRRIARGQLVTRDPRRSYVFPAASRPDEPWEAHGRPYREYAPAPARVAELLGIEAGIATLRRRRVMSPAGEPPFQLVDTWLSATAVRDAPQIAEASTGPGGYLDRIEEAGHGPLSWTEYARARMPIREEAQLLEISEEMPVLETVIVGKSARDGSILEVTVRVIPADRVELVTQLRRDKSASWPVEPISPE